VRLRSVWRNLRHRGRVERDLDEELAAHLEMVIDVHLAGGVDPAEARRRALIEVGGVEQVKEAVRAGRAGRRLETIARDLRQGVRSLRRSPGFTLAVVLSLGLGIGANTAIFSLVEALFLRPLPVADPQALVFFTDRDGTRGSSYFDTVGMRLLRGPRFSGDERAAGPARVVLTEAAARVLFGDEEPLGRRLHEHGRVPKDMEVVGLVRDAHVRGLLRPAPPMYYVPITQQDDFAGSIELRAVGDPERLAPEVLRVLRQELPAVALVSVRTMRAQVERSLTGERMLAMLSSVLAVAAVLLVALGLHGVIAQWAAQRTQEIGVRMALGATAGRVRWLVLRQALVLVLIGLAVGVPAALGSSRLLAGMLFGVRAGDPATTAAAGLALCAFALLAAYLPACRASRIDPIAALRGE
jgi:hypothetical protein